jgi:pyruvate kinase
VIVEAEAMPSRFPVRSDTVVLDDPIFSLHGRALCEAAVTLAQSGEADAIVAVTRGGKTARLLSAFRPRAPIFAATSSEVTAARMSLLWGVTPVICGSSGLDGVRDTLLSRGLLARDAVVVFVRVSADRGHPHSNFLHLQKIGDDA